MLNLEDEVVRHITHGNFGQIRNQNLTPELFNLKTPRDATKLVRVQSLLEWGYDFWKNYQTAPPSNIIVEEFPWVEEDAFLAEPETDLAYLSERLKKRYAASVQRSQIEELVNASPEEYALKIIENSRRVYQTLASNDYTVHGDTVFQIIDRQKSRISESKHLGASLGFEIVTEWTGGVRAGHLAFNIAKPKRMKTWFAIKGWLDQCLQGGRPVLFTLELSKEEIVGRVLCLLSTISYNRYFRGELLPHEWKAIHKAAEVFATFGGSIVALPLGNRFVSSIVLEADRAEADSIIVDQFSFLQWSSNHFKENEGYKEIVYDMKNSAVTYDMPWYVMAQLNRQQDDDDFPTASNSGLTRAVEEAADLLMGIKINDALREENLALFGVVEGRHCESGTRARWTVSYEFKASTQFEYYPMDPASV